MVQTTRVTHRIGTNKAGGPSYPAGVMETALRYLMTGMMGGSYYSTAEQIDEEAIALFEAALEQDEETFAKMIVYARENGLTHRAPIAATVVLTKAQDKTLATRVAKRVLVTPDDLAVFVGFTENSRAPRVTETYNKRTKTVAVATEGTTKALKIRGQGRVITRIIQERLAALSPYHVIKYGSQSQTMSLRDMYRIGHPTLTGSAQAAAAYVVKGAVTPELDEQVRGYLFFKETAATGDTDRALELVRMYSLPWEIVTGQMGGADKKRVWTAMLYQMPYMALLRNLRNLITHGALDDDKHLAYVTGVLADPRRVAKSKQFPFAFYNAQQALRKASHAFTTKGQQAAYIEVMRALETALDLSVSNVPDLGTTLVANDVSGSMTAPAKTTKGTDPISCMDLAALFAAAVYKSSERATVVSFDDTLYSRDNLSRAWGVTTLMSKLTGRGGGTSLWLPVDYMLKNHAVTYDTFVGFTDSESWAGEGFYSENGTRTQALLTQYRQTRNPGLRAYLVQLTPTGARATDHEDSLTHYIAGWSNDVLRYIGMGSVTMQLDNIRDMVLD